MVSRFQASAALCVAALAGNSMSSLGQLQAGCPCERGGGLVASAPVMSPYVAAPQMQMMSPPVAYQAPVQGYPVGGHTGSVDIHAGAVPPPGTIGQTYQMRSRPIPASMHPRAGMVDLKVANATTVIIHPMNANLAEDRLSGFQDQHDPSLWHFTSEPLMPGLSHIYRIEAQVAGPNGVTTQERYVRLIMGRLLEVTF